MSENDRQHRSFTIEQTKKEVFENKVRIAISSETPYLRSWAYGEEKVHEILGHKADEVIMDYFVEGAPLALEHNVRDQIGVIENVSLDPDGVMRADVRFSKSQKAQEIKQDVLDGIRTRVSVGYEVIDFEETESPDQYPAVRVTKWRPYEASIVAIPADITVGVGKSLDLDPDDVESTVQEEEVEDLEVKAEEIEDLEVKAEEVVDTIEEVTDEQPEEVEMSEPEIDESESEEDEDEVAQTQSSDEEDVERSNTLLITRSLTGGTRLMEKNEQAQLARIANEFNRTADLPEWIESGRSVASVMEEILDERSNAHKAEAPVLSKKEQDEVSLARSIEGLYRGEDSIVNEMGKEIAQRNGIDVRSNAIYIPLTAPIFKRTYGTTTGVDAAGPNIVSKLYLSFEEALREQSILGRLGVGIQQVAGTLTLPRGAGATATWVGENLQVSPSSGSISTVTWSPKTLALDVPYTRQLGNLDAIYSVEEIVRQDVLGALMEGMEKAVFQGSGSLQPGGLEYDSNIGQTAVATGSAIAFNDFVQIHAAQATAKGSQMNLHYVMAPSLYAKAITTPQFASTSGPGIINNGMINGIPALMSNHVTVTTNSVTNDTARVVFGDFSKVLVAHFGVIELAVNPYRQSDYRRNTLEGTLFMDSHARQPGDLRVHLGLNPLV